MEQSTLYWIAFGISLFCWAVFYVMCLLGIKKNIFATAFHTWYFNKDKERLPKKMIKETCWEELNNIYVLVWFTWFLSGLWAGLAILMVCFAINS